MKFPLRVISFTSNRSEYDLLSYLYQYLSKDEDIDFRLLVSGAHLSPTFGMTIKGIEKDGIRILEQIETQLDSDSDAARIKSASILLQNAIQSVQRFAPDLLMYAGDREEVLIAAMIGGYLKIPTAHFFAGDHDQDGLIDNPVRHAASKLSAYKFVSLKEHKDRLISIGEDPATIYVVGSCALDKFKYERRMSQDEVDEVIRTSGRSFPNGYALVIFHPLMAQEDRTVRDLRNILEALLESNICAMVNVPNVDPGARELLKVIQEYANDERVLLINNLERNLFINYYRHAIFQIGNSSSGILEAASIPIPVINVGDRMVGRASQKNVIFVDSTKNSIIESIRVVRSDAFQQKNIVGLTNRYGDGDSSRRAYEIIKNLDLSTYAEFRKRDPLNRRGVLK